MPDEVRQEIEPYFLNSDPVVDEDSRKLPKLDDSTADYVHRGLTVSEIFFLMVIVIFLLLYCDISCSFLFFSKLCSLGGVI